MRVDKYMICGKCAYKAYIKDAAIYESINIYGICPSCACMMMLPNNRPCLHCGSMLTEQNHVMKANAAQSAGVWGCETCMERVVEIRPRRRHKK